MENLLLIERNNLVYLGKQTVNIVLAVGNRKECELLGHSDLTPIVPLDPTANPGMGNQRRPRLQAQALYSFAVTNAFFSAASVHAVFYAGNSVT